MQSTKKKQSKISNTHPKEYIIGSVYTSGTGHISQ